MRSSISERLRWAVTTAYPLSSDPRGKVGSPAECPSPLILNFYHQSLFSLAMYLLNNSGY